MEEDVWYFLKRNGAIEQISFPYKRDMWEGNFPSLKGKYQREEDNLEWKSIPKEDFLSVNEIAEHQLIQMTCEQLLSMSKMKKEELIGLHFSYGMWLRNSYGLWHPNNPFVVKDDLGDGHPDGLSMLVIERIHTRLTTFVPTKPDAFQDAMSIVQEK